jgi:hypothetical protein
MASPRSPLSREEDASPTVRVRSTVNRGRLGVYAGIGAAVGAVPIPWLPDTITRRVRGALLHDVAVRHGLSLTREARDLLAEPSGPDGPRGLLAQALSFFGAKLALRAFTRFGPIGLVWPARAALQTYVLGHLFDRYLELGRTERAVRIDVEEARRVRQALDGALARSITLPPPAIQEPTEIDDQRDAVTAFVDGMLGLAAGLPDRLMRRLEAAFDDLLAHGDG